MKRQYENLKEKTTQKQKDLQIELQRILAGKKSLLSFFSKTTKEQNIEEIEKKILDVIFILKFI